MREKFIEQLQTLYRQMTVMGGLCQQAIAVAVRTLEEEEETAEKLEAQVFALDGEVDDMEREIETLCTKLLLKQQPRGRRPAAHHRRPENGHGLGAHRRPGLRHRGAGRFIRKGGKHEHLHEMAREVIRMVSDAVEAFVHLDLEQARAVIAYDDVVDRWFNQIKSDLVEQIAADKSTGEELLDIFMVAKYLERIGDHATNLAEWVEYAPDRRPVQERPLGQPGSAGNRLDLTKI